MREWKPLLIVIPAGLVLGAVGGQYARPELIERAADPSLQSLFESRTQGNGTDSAPPELQDEVYYADQYSYPPYLDDRMLGSDREITGWQGPTFSDWAEYKPAPMPSVAQLQAQVAARDAALGKRAWGGYGEAPEDVSAAEAASEAAADASASAGQAAQPSPANNPAVAATGDEPRTPDGDLPAIW
jgi:hypothetical protein